MAKISQIAEFKKPLSVREERLVEGIAIHNMTIAQGGRFAGMAPGTANAVITRPHVVVALQEARAANARAMEMTRDKVMQGYLDAVEQAKILGEPMTQVAAWREVGKMCGFDKPEESKGVLTDKQRRFLDMIQQLPEEQLAILAAKDVNIIDAETSEGSS